MQIYGKCLKLFRKFLYDASRCFTYPLNPEHKTLSANNSLRKIKAEAFNRQGLLFADKAEYEWFNVLILAHKLEITTDVRMLGVATV